MIIHVGDIVQLGDRVTFRFNYVQAENSVSDTVGCHLAIGYVMDWLYRTCK